ncbi:hypothetical protein SEPCBS57363_000221 [Sporothrix epigloea]|uniref:Aminoglycoside phosphotransferase domain-containing protein n=1 Tax=Sporothrix epigloea TaxID=1892477 RepID=A0ABP0D3J3_9PEZI
MEFPHSPEKIREMMRGAPETDQVLRSVESFPSRFRALAPRFARRNKRDTDRGPFPLCHLDLYHNNVIIDDNNFDVLAIIDWETACTLPLELVQFPRFLDLMPPRLCRTEAYDADGQLYDEYGRQQLRERSEYLQMVQEHEAVQQKTGAGGDSTLSACLSDKFTQDMSYIFSAFKNGKMGIYDNVLDDLEKELARDGDL